MKYYLPLLPVILIFGYTSIAQHVGIGKNNPTYTLDVEGNDLFNVRITNASSTTVSIFMWNSLGAAGSFGVFQNQVTIDDANGNGIALRSGSADRMVVNSAGRVGIGVSAGAITESLEIGSGNIKLNNANKGIMLNAADQPIITRGWDAFTSGDYTGLGRWGLFMEPTRLVLGIPNTVGRAFEFAAYEANSTRNTILTIDRVGGVKRPATNNHDLLPVCMGSVRWNNGDLANTPVLNGTGNFTLTPYAEGGFVEITIDGHFYTTGNYVTQVTCIRDDGYGSSTGRAVVRDSGNGKLQVYTYINGNTQYSRSFHFVVYKIN